MKIKKPPVVVRVLLGIVSVVLCIALFATMVAAMVIGDIRVLTNKDNLQTFFSQVLFATPKKNAPVILRQGVGVGGVRLEEPEAGLTDVQQMLVDYVYGMLEEQFGEEMPITEEKVEELLDQSTVPEFLSEKMAGIMSDVLTGEVTTTITPEEVVELLEENEALIEDTFGVEITDEHKNTISAWVEEADIVGTVEQVVKGNLGFKDPAMHPDVEGGEGNIAGSDNISVDNILNGDISSLLALFREITSTTVLLSVLGVAAVIVLLLFLLNYWKPYAAVRCVGITAMIAALPFVLVSVLMLAVPALLEEMSLGIVTVLLQPTILVHFGVFGGGVILLVLSIVWGSIAKKKERTLYAEEPILFTEQPVEETHEI